MLKAQLRMLSLFLLSIRSFLVSSFLYAVRRLAFVAYYLLQIKYTLFYVFGASLVPFSPSLETNLRRQSCRNTTLYNNSKRLINRKLPL